MKYIMRKSIGFVALLGLGYMVALFVTGQFQQSYIPLVMFCAGAIIILSIGKLWRRILYLPIRVIRKVLLFWL